MTHPNAELLGRYLTTLSAGKAVEAIEYFTDDCALHVPGRSPHAGTYRGKEAVLDYYTKVFQDTEGRFENLGIDDILASDTHAATLVHWRVTRGGRTLDVDRVVIYRIADGRIAEIWVRDWDQYAYDELFADLA